jgi:hypothetical protein
MAFWYAQIAQLVEQGIENPRVGGSNPSLGTIFNYADTRVLNKRSAQQRAGRWFKSVSSYYFSSFICRIDRNSALILLP